MWNTKGSGIRNEIMHLQGPYTVRINIHFPEWTSRPPTPPLSLRPNLGIRFAAVWEVLAD